MEVLVPGATTVGGAAGVGAWWLGSGGALRQVVKASYGKASTLIAMKPESIAMDLVPMY